MNEIFSLERGDGPLLISAPHIGTRIPGHIEERLSEAARSLSDTDWDVDRLYPFARELGATVLRARQSRYVIDLNRDPHGLSLYPGARTTGLCPTETFEGHPLYADGEEPTDHEIAARRAAYWDPYHDALRDELLRIRAAHGYALLLDVHSIWGRLPLLFDGELPDINIGSDGGRSCDSEMTDAMVGALGGAPYSYIVNGRFKGGYITRRYGSPAHRVHAVQIELNQRTYLVGGTRFVWDHAKADAISAVLHRVCAAMLGWARDAHLAPAGLG